MTTRLKELSIWKYELEFGLNSKIYIVQNMVFTYDGYTQHDSQGLANCHVNTSPAIQRNKEGWMCYSC